MCELLGIDLEGIQPTLKHVPPNVPRFSIHACGREGREMSDDWIKWHKTDFETELGSLNRGHVSTRTLQDKPVTSHFNLEMRATDIPPPMTTASYCPEGLASPHVIDCC